MTPFVGQIMAVGFNFAPRGWLLCDGQLLSISAYTAVFSLLGTTFGGDGRTTFQLPDLRGRSIAGVGSGPGLQAISWGERTGANTHTLTTNQMPSHNHTASGHMVVKAGSPGENASSDVFLADGAYYGEDGANTSLAAGSIGVTVNPNGSNQSFSLMQPVLGMYVCIAMTGVYPSRS